MNWQLLKIFFSSTTGPWHRASLGEGDSSLLKWRTRPSQLFITSTIPPRPPTHTPPPPFQEKSGSVPVMGMNYCFEPRLYLPIHLATYCSSDFWNIYTVIYMLFWHAWHSFDNRVTAIGNYRGPLVYLFFYDLFVNASTYLLGGFKTNNKLILTNK